MPAPAPTLLIIAGSNGAGKSTFAVPYAKQRGLPFLNADELTLKYELAGESQPLVKAAREFLATVASYIARGESVCFETTLSGGYVHGLVADAKTAGFRVEVVYLFVADVSVAVDRVAARVLKGGHHVPKEDIRRRFQRSLANFERLRGKLDAYRIYFSEKGKLVPIAELLDGELAIPGQPVISLIPLDQLVTMSRNAASVVEPLTPSTREELQLMQEVAAAALAENRAYGIPDFEWRDGRMVYTLPDGTETTERPEILWKRT